MKRVLGFLNLILPRRMAICCCMGLIISYSGAAQEVQNTEQVYKRYDTLITGQGYGEYQLSFPKWDIRTGKLLSVRIEALVTVQYGFVLQNVDNQPDSFTVSIGRNDSIQNSFIKPIYSSHSFPVGTFLLDSVNLESQVPHNLLTNYSNSDSIKENLAAFTGSDKIVFSFLPLTWSHINSKNHSSFHYSATIRDSTLFSVTYYYQPAPLATLTRFSADKQDASQVQLRWIISNESAGRKYEVEAGRDGVRFDLLSSTQLSHPGMETTDYQFPYTLPTENAGGYFFRLKTTDSNGTVSYSEVRKIPFSGLDGELNLFPNPATSYIRLSFDDPVPGNWQVDILASDGRIVQRNSYSNSNVLLLNLNRNLPAGLYVASATNSQTARHYLKKFLIR